MNSKHAKILEQGA